MSLHWRDEFSIDHSEIDNQHKILFKLLNNLEESTYSTDFEDIIPSTLEELKNYVEIHFETEEKYMAEKEYPGLQEHHQIHEDLKKRVYEEIKLNHDEGYSTIKVMHLYNFLKKWIEEHILIEDHKF
ncbi:bacteriohemerythrin [Fusibacter ferrireducens]|uniref:Hemerythrin family protein n=1 Tax=Fusibacter ferrireducens TaxID=2785058 RepID=A0ABR9ZV82_9FIRM|nr:bacteriohemerythrin [Fusibacter ferrireducens]MBF4693810.1 hemerythrin family protein [Fusibacter ferrireducens]